MPNCFTLTDKTTGERAVFAYIDNDMRKHFNQPDDPDKYLWGWYDTIGLGLAMGKTWDEMRTWWDDNSPMQKVINYLEERYTPDAWYQPR